MAEFTFLGVNGSCQSASSGNTSLLVCSGGHSMAVDLSCNLAAVVDAEPEIVVLTHEHIDHVYGLPSFLHQSWLRGRTKPLRICIPAGMEHIPEGMLSLFKLREKKNMFDIQVLPAEPFLLGNARVSFFTTDHTATSLGLILEEDGKTLLYTCDTRPITEAPVPHADVLIHEASGTADAEETLIRKGHSSGRDAARLAASLGAGTLYLVHLPMDPAAACRILAEAREGFPEAAVPGVLAPCAL